MNTKSKAYMVGGGIGSLAAAALLIRDGNIPGGNFSILETAPLLGGSLDGPGGGSNPALQRSYQRIVLVIETPPCPVGSEKCSWPE